MAKARSEWSGQVFIETVASIGHKDASYQRWTAKCVGSANGFTKFRSKGRGAGSLLDISTRICLANSAFLTAETMGNVPWHVGSRLWEIIKKNQLDSVQTWQTFAAVYADVSNDKGLKYRLKYIRKPRASLLDYITPIRCEKSSWLTIVTLQNMVATRGQVVQGIASLLNLEVLNIGPGLGMMLNESDRECSVGVDDAVIEAWSRHARVLSDDPNKPFRALKILTLAVQPDVSLSCLSNCGHFPALQLINFMDCKSVKSDHNDSEEYWGLVDETYTSWATWLEKRPNNVNFTGWNNFALACLRHIGASDRIGNGAVDSLGDASRPRLHLLLGEDWLYHWNHPRDLEMLSYERKEPYSEHQKSDADDFENVQGRTHSRHPREKQKKEVMDIKETLAQFLS